MIPKNIPDEELDDGIRSLVININRIPGIDTASNCEGHEEYAPPMLPVKGGWMYFMALKRRHLGLVRNMEAICGENSFSSIHEDKNEFSRRITRQVCAGFESFESFENKDYKNLFHEVWNDQQKAEFMARARERKVEMLSFWSKLDEVVVQYLKKKVSLDYLSLPYRDERVVHGRMCGF